jgi:hypothetical protein
VQDVRLMLGFVAVLIMGCGKQLKDCLQMTCSGKDLPSAPEGRGADGVDAMA